MTLGWHVIAEYEQCDKHKIDDVAYVEKHLNKAAELAGATISLLYTSDAADE